MAEPKAPKRKTSRVVLQGQARDIVCKVYDFMKEEATYKHVKKLTDARWRTATAVGISEKTVTRILAERRSGVVKFDTPMKRRRVEPRKINPETIDIGTVRRSIQEYHKQHKRFPYLRQLNDILKDKIGFDACLTSLRTFLVKLGYKYRKVDNRKCFTETHAIQMQRLNYLRQVRTLRQAGRPIVYTDETAVRPDQLAGPSDPLADPDPSAKDARGVRIHIFHAGNEQGFVPNALLVYKEEQRPGEDYEKTKRNNYLYWLEQRLVPNLPRDAVLVMDNAPHHNMTADDVPTSKTSHDLMFKWLHSKGIPFHRTATKVETYDLIVRNKEKYKCYKVDELLKSHGVQVLRLPSYHPELNPIVKIWEVVKAAAGAAAAGEGADAAMAALCEQFLSLGAHAWAAACRDVHAIEDEYLQYYQLDITE